MQVLVVGLLLLQIRLRLANVLVQFDRAQFQIALGIAESENVEVADAEVNMRIQQLALQAKKEPEKFKKELAENNRIGMILDDLKAQKALESMMPDAKAETSAA